MSKALLLTMGLIGGIAVSSAVLAADPGVAAEKVNYVTGGVGEDSLARMAALGKEFNLKLLFAAKDGHYLGDVAVTIAAEGNRKILEAASDGPFLYAQLRPGKYAITATYAGTSQTRSTAIAASGRRELIFRWEEAAESPAADASITPR